MAYVNFEKSDCAKSVRRALLPRLQKVLGRHIALDPAGVIRDQEGIFCRLFIIRSGSIISGKIITHRNAGKFVPDRYNRAALGSTETASIQRTANRRSSPIPRRPVAKRTEMPGFRTSIRSLLLQNSFSLILLLISFQKKN